LSDILASRQLCPDPAEAVRPVVARRVVREPQWDVRHLGDAPPQRLGHQQRPAERRPGEEFRSRDQHQEALVEILAQRRTAEPGLTGIHHHLDGAAIERTYFVHAGEARAATAELGMIHDVEHDAIAGPDGVLHRVPDRGVDLRQWPGAAVGVARRDRNPGAGEAGDRRAVGHRAPRRAAGEMAAGCGGRHAIAALVCRHDDAGHRFAERPARQQQRLQRAVGARGRQHDLGIRQVESAADRASHLVGHTGEDRRDVAARARRLQLREGGLGRRVAASRYRARGRGRQADLVRARRRPAAIEVQAVGRVEHEAPIAARDQGRHQGLVGRRNAGVRPIGCLQRLFQPHRGPLSIRRKPATDPCAIIPCGGGIGRLPSVGRTALTRH